MIGSERALGSSFVTNYHHGVMMGEIASVNVAAFSTSGDS